MSTLKKISIVVPCYNEEKSILSLCETINKMLSDVLVINRYETIFADDYS